MTRSTPELNNAIVRSATAFPLDRPIAHRKQEIETFADMTLDTLVSAAGALRLPKRNCTLSRIEG